MVRIKVHFFTLLLLALTALSACVDDDIVRRPKDGVEGDPAKVYIRLQDMGLNPKTRGLGLSDEEEKEIKSLFIFVFGEDDMLISSAEYINVTLQGNGTNWDPISIQSVVGNNRQIYAIANYNSQVIENVKSVESLNDLKNLVVENLGNPLSQEYGIIKVGSCVTDIRDGEVYDVPLKNLVAKVTVKVVNKSSDFKVEGWTIDGFSLKSYVVERPFEKDNLNYHDAPNINDGGDFYNSFSDQVFDFDTTTPDQGNGSTYSITGYCYENRRGGRISREAPPVGWPNGDETSGTRKPYQEKTWYAPKNATRVKIIGHDTAKNRALVISYFLGANDTDDYNVERGTHYTYTITVNNLNDIDINTNVEQFADQLPVSTPPDLTNIDAHASMRMFQLHTNQLQPGSGVISFEVLSSINTDTDRPDWLKVAVFPLINYQVKGNATTEADISKWQQDGITPGYYARTKFIPHKSVRQKLGVYTPPTGIVLGDQNSDYPADDDELPFAKALHRMCYKVTNIPIPATYDPAGNPRTPMFVYADEFEYSPDVMAPSYREAIVKVTYIPNGGTPEASYYTLRQYRPILFMGLPGDNAPMLIERTEDYNSLIQLTLPLDRQLLNGMQWGPVVAGQPEQATSIANGYLNTAQAVYTNVTTNAGNYSWSAERTKYGSNIGGWQGSQGSIAQPVDGSYIEGRPYFMFNYSGPDAYNTVFNTTAARYCHEKNADINGDGTISPSETLWYLPSQQELQMMWTYNEMLDLSPMFYWSSTLPVAGGDNAFAISMRRSASDLNTVYNGVPQARPRTAYKENSLVPPRVRCVRRSGGLTSLSPIVSHTIEGRSVIDCSNLSGDMYTVTSKMGLSQKDVGGLQNANTKVYRKFEVQRSADNTPVTYPELVHGTGKCNQSQGWRLPTQRELLIIWSVKDKLEANPAFTRFQAGEYWTMLRATSGNYLVDFTTGLASYCPGSGENPHRHYYRCIREL